MPAWAPEGGDGDAITCTAPRFDSPCDATVQVVVDGGTVMPGAVRYSFFAPPTIDLALPAVVPLAGGVPLTITGEGWFGVMLTDAVARSVGEELMARVDAQLAALDEAAAAVRARHMALAFTNAYLYLCWYLWRSRCPRGTYTRARARRRRRRPRCCRRRWPLAGRWRTLPTWAPLRRR